MSPPRDVGLPSLSLPFSLSLTYYLVGLTVVESGSLDGSGWSETGRKPCLSLKAWELPHDGPLPGPWLDAVWEPCWSEAPELSRGPLEAREAECVLTGAQCRPHLCSSPSPSQCLEKFPVIQHFKFGSLLPIHPVTSC